MPCFCNNFAAECNSSSYSYVKIKSDFMEENWYLSDIDNQLEEYVDLVDRYEIKHELRYFIEKPIYFVYSTFEKTNVIF